MRLGYPKSVAGTPPAVWSECSLFMQRLHLGDGLGDFYQNESHRCEVVHVLRIPFAVNIPVMWQRHITKTANALQHLIPNLRLFVAPKGLGNLCRKRHKYLIATVSCHADMLCFDFSRDVDLLRDVVNRARPKRPRLS